MNAEEYASGKLVLDFPAEAVGRLRLNNPDKRNPLDHEVLDALAGVLPELDRGIDIRCVVITGTGKAFSAGYDIGSIPAESFERDAEALVAHPFAAAMDAVSAHPFPVLAAINGHCLGGGLELAVRCDLRVCAEGAKLGMPPAKLGLIYGHTGLERFIDVDRSRRHAGSLPDRARPGFGEGAADRPGERARGRRRGRADAAVALAAEIAGNAPLSMKGNKHAIEMLARKSRLSDEVERELVELRESCFAPRTSARA